MSTNHTEEPMEVDPSEDVPESTEKKDEALLTLAVQWSDGAPPQKCKVVLQKVLQTWANKNILTVDFTVLNVSEDGTAQITIKPARAVSELQDLSGQVLTSKDHSVTISSVILPPPEQKTQKPKDASVNVPPEPQNEEAQTQNLSSSAAVSAAGEETCVCPVPVNHFWYVNHVYQEELRRIQKENGVQMVAEVTVRFEANGKDGSPEKALSDFTNLAQKCIDESEGSVIPLGYVDPDQWKDTLDIIQGEKPLLTLSSGGITVYGPGRVRDAVRKSLNPTQNTWASRDTSMSIKDPLLDSGLTMEADTWRLMMTSLNEQVAKIKAKFGVDFDESGIRQGKVDVKARHKRPGGNASMESHAVRALLRLYQKITAMGGLHQPQGASGGHVSNGQTDDSNTEAPASEGAAAGDDKDDNCPICLDTFKNKKRLKCKHEFCDECLARSKMTTGPICPICKDVFGVMEGNQPHGSMRWNSNSSSLPGYKNCGTITINYDIPSGTQTEKHPNPGRYYSGAHRTAYLPDNDEGRDVLKLLKKAFDQKLIFTVGTSTTTGAKDTVTWNDIHHKTSTSGGSQSFGYPDSDYLRRVKDELKAKGIK